MLGPVHIFYMVRYRLEEMEQGGVVMATHKDANKQESKTFSLESKRI